jgi:hypothetical protein
MTDVKLNFRGMHETHECDICNEEDDLKSFIIMLRNFKKERK